MCGDFLIAGGYWPIVLWSHSGHGFPLFQVQVVVGAGHGTSELFEIEGDWPNIALALITTTANKLGIRMTARRLGSQPFPSSQIERWDEGSEQFGSELAAFPD